MTSIRDFGAVGDGATLDTRAIQTTVDYLADKGGGTVHIPAGTFLTGALFLKPGVHLNIDDGGMLKGTTDTAQYPRSDTRIEGHTEPWCPAIVNASRCDGLRITGQGTIQGGGKPFWDAFWNRFNADPSTKNLDVYRPRNIFIEDSKDVLVRGLRLRASGFWNLHLFRCERVVVEDLDIRAPYPSPSTDGVDIDSSRHVTVRRCFISVNDDCIAIKGNKGPAADRQADIPPVEHVRISDCTFGLGHGVMTLGSEACVVRDVVMENCTVEHAADSPETNVLARLKIRPDTPQHYSDIHWRNIRVSGKCELIAIKPWTQYFDLKGQPQPRQTVDNITLDNITGTVDSFGLIDAPAMCGVGRIELRRIDVKYQNPASDGRVTLKGIESLVIEGVTVNGLPIERIGK